MCYTHVVASVASIPSRFTVHIWYMTYTAYTTCMYHILYIYLYIHVHVCTCVHMYVVLLKVLIKLSQLFSTVEELHVHSTLYNYFRNSRSTVIVFFFYKIT